VSKKKLRGDKGGKKRGHALVGGLGVVNFYPSDEDKGGTYKGGGERVSGGGKAERGGWNQTARGLIDHHDVSKNGQAGRGKGLFVKL